MVGNPVLVGLAEVQATNGAAMLTCLGLGSCVSVCALDPVSNVSGMAHIMLPGPGKDIISSAKPASFADSGVEELVRSMEGLGAERSRMVAAVAGGASMLSQLNCDFGRRTADAVLKKLRGLGIKCSASDLGGHQGRNVTLLTDSGKVFVSTVAKGESELCSLRG